MTMIVRTLTILITIWLCWTPVYGFSLAHRRSSPCPQVFLSNQHKKRIASITILKDTSDNNSIGISNNDVSELLTSRVPTSVDDQVRQACESIVRASKVGQHRHIIRLLLPIIGATELDDWPGGSRQQIEAAYPLVEEIIKEITKKLSSSSNNNNNNDIVIQSSVIDESDGVIALFVQAENSKDDSCTILLPTADTLSNVIYKKIDKEVGSNRNLILINPQWRRKTDFSNTNNGNPFSWMGGDKNGDKATVINYIEQQYIPTFTLTNMICEGETIRIVRAYPGPWRIYLQMMKNDNDIDYILIGTKDIVVNKPASWDNDNQQDGGRLFDCGYPTYQEIYNIIISSPNYKIKNPAERALASFNFMKDTL